jgi:hypothetical protein
MATVSVSNSTNTVDRSDSVWNSRFGPAERERMLDDDSTAFRTVSFELAAIVCLGFLLLGGTSAAILLTSLFAS